VDVGTSYQQAACRPALIN